MTIRARDRYCLLILLDSSESVYSVDWPDRRTAAATAARRRQSARRAALDLAARLDQLDDAALEMLTAVVALAALRRGLEVPELFVE